MSSKTQTRLDRLGNHKLVLVIDVLVFVSLAYICARLIYRVPPTTFFSQIIPAAAVVAVSLYLLSVFEITLEVTLSSLLSRALISVMLALSILLIIIYLIGPGSGRHLFGRGVLAISMTAFSGYLLATRYLLFKYIRRKTPFNRWVFVGDSVRYRNLVDNMKHLDRHRVALKSQSWLGDNLGGISEQGIILDRDVYASDHIAERLIQAKFNGINVISLEQFYEDFLERVPLTHVEDEWFLSSAGFSYVNDSIRQRVKKTIDLALVVVTLPITLTLFCFFSVLIVLVDRQSPFFSQPRTGQHGRVFTLHKLRTMRNVEETISGEWTRDNDVRITKLGNWLRRYRLDEIPQLFNVLTGTMSIIGPRPEQPSYTEMLSKEIPYYDIRHAIKPGITGWAQVRFPYGASVNDARSKLEFDLYYIKNYSLLLDVSILIKTCHTIFSGSGR